MRKTLLAATAALWITWCASIHKDMRDIQIDTADSAIGLLWENPKNQNTTYWESGEKIKDWDGITCQSQVIFDRTTWKPIWFLPDYITEYWRKNNKETVQICEDTWLIWW